MEKVIYSFFKLLHRTAEQSVLGQRVQTSKFSLEMLFFFFFSSLRIKANCRKEALNLPWWEH